MDIKTIGIILLSGFIILIGAILVNLIAKSLELSTWFDFLEDIKNKGFSQTIKQIGFISILYLILIYPFILGVLVWICFKLFK